MFYFLILAVLFVVFMLAIFEKFFRLKINKTTYIFLIIVFSIIIAFRPEDLFPDTTSYIERYYGAVNNVDLLDIIKTPIISKVKYYSLAPGASLISFFSVNIGLPYWLFSFIISFFELHIIFFSLIKLFNKWKVKCKQIIVFLVLLCFYSLYYQFIAWAQGLAMVFTVVSFLYWISDKKFKSIIFSVISISIHLSGIMIIPLIIIFCYSKKLKKKTYIFVCLLLTFVYVLEFVGLLPNISDTLITIVVNFASKYNSLYLNYIASSENSISITNLVTFLFICFLIIYSDDNEINYRIINILLFGELLFIVFSSWDICHRLCDVLFLFIIVLVTNVLSSERNKNKDALLFMFNINLTNNTYYFFLYCSVFLFLFMKIYSIFHIYLVFFYKI